MSFVDHKKRTKHNKNKKTLIIILFLLSLVSLSTFHTLAKNRFLIILQEIIPPSIIKVVILCFYSMWLHFIFPLLLWPYCYHFERPFFSRVKYDRHAFISDVLV